MKHKLFTLVLSIILLSGESFAQNLPVDISDFRLPNLERHELNFGLGFSGNNHFGEQSPTADSLENSIYRKNTYDFSPKLRYGYFFNSDKRQTYVNVNSNWDLQASSRETKNERVEYQNNHSFSNIDVVNRFYFKPKFFIETDIHGYFMHSEASHTNHYLTNDSLIRTNNKNTDVRVMIPLKMGFGRIEQVSDAAHAVYIINALKEADRANENLSSKESIFELAELAAELKNKRFFDQRIRRIYELEALDSFLTKNNHINDKDIRYFSNLQDMWVYGGKYSRYSGSRFSIGVSPAYESDLYRYHNINDTFTQHTIVQSAALSAEYDYYKPLNMKWQHDFSASASYIFNKEININGEQDSSVYVIPAAEFELSEGFSYYPSTRSRFDADAGANYYQNINKTNEAEYIQSNNDSGINVFFRLNGSYYISPQLRLSFTYNMYSTLFKAGDVSISEYDTQQTEQNYGLTLTYSLF